MLSINRLHVHVATLLGLATPLDAQSVAGCWAGTVGSGPAQRRAALELVSAAGGGWTGAAHVLSRSIDTDSLADVTVTGTTVTFRAPSRNGSPSFAARLQDDVLAGEMTRGDSAVPFRFTRTGPAPDPASRLIGYWAGWLEQNRVGVLRAGLKFVPAPCGQVLVTFDSPDQGTADLPMTSFSTLGDSVLFEMSYLGGAFRGSVVGDDSLTGLWRQGGAILELRLARTDSAPGIDRPQDPKPPFPYMEEDVTFENPEDGVTLAGTLTVPDGDGPFPAAVMLTGSGAQDRNEALVGHRPFLVIADHLTRRGVAVLRYDDRGVGGSSGNLMATTLAQNAADALAAVRLLRAHPKIAADRIGLIGHSEGGWMAPIAATRSDDIAFIIMLAGPAVSGEEILDAQTRAILEATAASAEFIAGNQVVARRMWHILRAEPDDSTARARILALIDTVSTGLPDAQRAALDSAWSEPGALERFQQSLASFVTPWFRDILDYDPREVLRRISVPALALYGALDLQVPPEQSAPVLEDLWAAHPDATIHIFPGLNHLFQHATTGLPGEYARIEETFAPAALEMMSAWILERFGTP